MLIVCAGLMRSGSTLHYNIVRQIIEEAHAGISVGLLVPETLNQYDFSRQHIVVKTHQYPDFIRPYVDKGWVETLMIVRDPRDALLSYMRKEGHPETYNPTAFTRENLNNYQAWLDVPRAQRIESRYEQVICNLPAEVQRVAGFLGINVSQHEADAIADQWTVQQTAEHINTAAFVPMNNGQYQVNPQTLLHDNHIYQGAVGEWREYLPASTVYTIEQLAGKWMKAHGYDPVSL